MRKQEIQEKETQEVFAEKEVRAGMRVQAEQQIMEAWITVCAATFVLTALAEVLKVAHYCHCYATVVCVTYRPS